MAVDSGKYDAIISGLTGAATGAPTRTPSIYSSLPVAPIDVGNDMGRGPGTPGGRGTGNAGMQPGRAPQLFSVDDVPAILRGMPPEKIAEIQRKMQTIGLLPENYKSFGFVDTTMRSGFGELLEVANSRGENNWANTLDLLNSGETSLGEARKAAARQAATARQQTVLGFDTALHTYEASDPASVRQTAEAAFQQALGRKPKKDEMDRFVQGFLKRERSSQEGVFDAQDRLAAGQRGRALAGADLADAASGAAVGGVDGLLAAIGGQESGGDYNARNGRTGASGKYQIMPGNWPTWSAQAGLGKNAPRTAENQEKVARYKMGEYVDKYGEQGAAVAWYGGEGAAKAWLKDPDAARFNRKQGKGNEPSINEYVQQVMGRMGGGAASSGQKSEGDILWENLQRLAADAPGKVTLGKRSRSYEEQVALYDKYKSGKGALAAKPGTSKHGDGRANDLKYENQATKRWVLENAGKYGLAFPLLDKGEDWHVELAAGSGATAAGGAPISTSVTTQRQDMGAQAVEFARNSNPNESKAYDIGGQFQSFVNILSKGVI